MAPRKADLERARELRQKRHDLIVAADGLTREQAHGVSDGDAASRGGAPGN